MITKHDEIRMKTTRKRGGREEKKARESVCVIERERARERARERESERERERERERARVQARERERESV